MKDTSISSRALSEFVVTGLRIQWNEASYKNGPCLAISRLREETHFSKCSSSTELLELDLLARVNLDLERVTVADGSRHFAETVHVQL